MTVNCMNLNCFLPEDSSRALLKADFPAMGFEIQLAQLFAEDIPWHSIAEMEIILVESGSLTVMIPHQQIMLESGNGIWINSEVLHQLSAKEYCRFRMIEFSANLVNGCENSRIAEKYISPLINCHALHTFILLASNREQKQLLSDFSDAFDQLAAGKFGYEISVRNILSRICIYICLAHCDAIAECSDPLSIDTVRVIKMLEYIHSHTDEQLRVSSLSSVVHVSNREIIRCFQRELHISPVQYALRYRIMLSAGVLMNERKKSILQTAKQFGFCRPSYYARMFKKYFRCTPKEYRSKNGFVHQC